MSYKSFRLVEMFIIWMVLEIRFLLIQSGKRHLWLKHHREMVEEFLLMELVYYFINLTMVVY